MTRRGNVVAIAVGVAVLVSACASDVAAPNTTVSEVEVATTPLTTSTDAPATPTTPTAPSTDAPTTTLDPAATLAADVEADLLETFRLTDLAIQEPTNDAKVAAALDGYIDSNRDLIQERLEDLRANGYVARPNPDVEAGVIVERPAVRTSSPANTAVIQVCEVDSWIVVEPGAGPDGSDAIVDPDVTSYRSNYVLSKMDGRWRIRGGETLGEWPGEAACPPE